MSRLSPIAVNDGNPNSTTATFASATFYDFGSQNDSPVQSTKSGSNTLGLAFDESSFRAAGFNGQVYQIPIVGNFKLADCMLVSTYFTVGAEVGYHFVLREADNINPFNCSTRGFRDNQGRLPMQSATGSISKRVSPKT